MISPTKPEVHNVSQRPQSEQDRATAIGNMQQKMLKTARVFPEISSWTDTHTHTDVLITILYNHSRGLSNYCQIRILTQTYFTCNNDFE